MSGGVVVGVIGAVVCIVAVVLIAWGLTTYNKLVRQRNQVTASWAQIDVQLKRRYDLIPNLVETVRGYAAHERGTLDDVVAARNNAIQTANASAAPQARADAENAITQTLGRLFALAEAYPNLKANQNFLALQGELSGTEDKIAYARQFYNSAVQSFNTSVQTVPTNIVAGIGGFKAQSLFEAAGAERGPVQVRF
jgi:LemA protein